MRQLVHRTTDDEGRIIEVVVELDTGGVRWDNFVNRLAKRAVKSKHKRATACDRSVVVEVVVYERDPRQTKLFEEKP